MPRQAPPSRELALLFCPIQSSSERSLDRERPVHPISKNLLACCKCLNHKYTMHGEQQPNSLWCLLNERKVCLLCTSLNTRKELAHSRHELDPKGDCLTPDGRQMGGLLRTTRPSTEPTVRKERGLEITVKESKTHNISNVAEPSQGLAPTTAAEGRP